MSYATFVGPAPLQKRVGIFVVQILADFAGDFPGGFFLGTFSHKNEEKKSGEKIRAKIRRPKKKIREKSFCQKPTLTFVEVFRINFA